MRTDKVIYLLFQLMPQGFFNLIGRNPDDAARYDFKSVEIKETAFRLDGVFVPKSKGDYTYFVEAQFQTDEHFYARFFAEVFLYLKQYPTKKWKGVVIYPTRSVEQKDRGNYELLLGLECFERVYLDELPDSETIALGLFKLLVVSEKRAKKMVRKMVKKASLKELDLIEQIITYKFSKLTREEVRAMLGIQKELLKETQFYKEVFEEGKRKGVLEGKRKGLLEGKRKGLLEGKRKGLLEGKLEAVTLLRRLGLSDEAIAKELNLPLDAVQHVPR